MDSSAFTEEQWNLIVLYTDLQRALQTLNTVSLSGARVGTGSSGGASGLGGAGTESGGRTLRQFNSPTRGNRDLQKQYQNQNQSTSGGAAVPATPTPPRQ
jgi:hypothetical protein